MHRKLTGLLTGAALLATAVSGCASPGQNETAGLTEEAATSAPASCVEAIRLARVGFSGVVVILNSYGKVVKAIPDALQAASLGSPSGIQAFTAVLKDSTADLNSVSDQLDPEAFNAAAAECEKAGA